MLSLRLIVFAGIAAIGLWGLFELLENLRQPALLRTAKTAVVKGCSAPHDADAARLCPQLLCQKALIERKLVALDARFTMSIDTHRNGRHVVGGYVTGSNQGFECSLTGLSIEDARLIRQRPLRSD